MKRLKDGFSTMRLASLGGSVESVGEAKPSRTFLKTEIHPSHRARSDQIIRRRSLESLLAPNSPVLPLQVAMAQGAVKKAHKTSKKFALSNPSMHSPTNDISRPTPTGPKRGNGSRVIKPKKPALISQNKIKKKHAAGLVGKTEKLLAEKAGHLEMLKGGKRDKKKEVKSG